MPIDASIYGAIQPQRPVNRLAELAQVMQVQGLSDQVETGRREREQTDSMNALYRAAVGPDGTIDRTKLMTGAASAGLGSKLPGMQKDWAAQDKATTEADNSKFKLAKERHDLFKSTLGALAQEPNLSKQLVMQAGQSLVSQGLLPAEMYQQAIATMPEDPQQLRQRLIQGVKAQMTPEQMFTVFAPKPEKFDTGAQILMRDTNPNSPTYGQQTGGGPISKTMTPDGAAADRRARERMDFDRQQSGPGGQGKAPAGYRWAADGKGLEPIPGGPAVKADNATEGERKAATLLQRLEGSQKQLTAALQTNPNAAKPGLVSSGLRAVGQEMAANTITNTQRQQVENAQLDILDAALTLGTGAAYTREQLEGYRRSYFPQVGDDPPTVKDKADRLNNVISAAKIAAGRAGKQAASANTGGASGDFGADPLGLR